MADGEPAVTDLSNSDVVSKYREAATIAGTVLKGIVASKLVAGVRIVDICKLGDSAIEQLVAPLYKSKKTMVRWLDLRRPNISHPAVCFFAGEGNCFPHLRQC
jgi:hypothetical protein